MQIIINQFIERVVNSDQPSNKLMSYGINTAAAEIKAMLYRSHTLQRASS